MHSSLSDILPSVNASEKMARVLARTKEGLTIRYPEHPLCPRDVTVSGGGIVSGGGFWGVYPGHAELGVDARTMPGMTREGLEDDIRSFLDGLRREDSELDVELEFELPPRDWWLPPKSNQTHRLSRLWVWKRMRGMGVPPDMWRVPQCS